MSEGGIKYRDLREGDLDFVLNSYLKSFKYSPLCKKIKPQIYFFQQQKIIKDILMKSKIKLACNAEDEDQIFGWILYQNGSGQTLHYAYIKELYRKAGIFKKLLQLTGFDLAQEILLTHLTYAFKDILDRSSLKALNISYDPYQLFMKGLQDD